LRSDGTSRREEVVDLPKDTKDDRFDDKEFGNRFERPQIVFESIIKRQQRREGKGNLREL
jgi:hypothetical protein